MGSTTSLPAMLKPRTVVVVALVGVLALVATACDSSGADETTTTTSEPATGESSTTTTAPPVTSIPSDSIPGSSSASIAPEVADRMRADIGVIILDVEESRGLPFLAVPTVTILDEAEFTARVNEQLVTELDVEEIDSQDAMFTLLGMLAPDDDLRQLLLDLYTEQVAGFYDPDAKELVVPVSVDGITPLQEIVIAHELTHALTDQHFDFNVEFERRVDEGTVDDASAILALVEGDATYQQFLYLESLDPAEAAAAALEAMTMQSPVLQASPEWLQKDLSFPYEQGLVFTGYLVSGDGLRGIDQAYQSPPLTTEQILDPTKYTRGEGPETLAALTVSLSGWDLADEASLGEWGTRLLLTDTLAPGELARAASGWGNDTYRLFRNGDDTAFVWSYLAETDTDAEELTNGLIAHARTAMGAGSTEESGGGLLFTGSPYVFIDRIDDAVFFIASTDPAAGSDLRSQLGL
jgi:hypothetical protein